MQGLLDVSTKTGNAKAYQIVLGMADYVDGRMQKLSASFYKQDLQNDIVTKTAEFV
jgi:hypothetical protein